MGDLTTRSCGGLSRCVDVSQCAEEIGFAFSSLKTVGLEGATQGDSVAKIDHHGIKGQIRFSTIRSPVIWSLRLERYLLSC